MGLVRQRFNQHLATAGMLSAIAAWPAAMHAQQWELVQPPAGRGTAGQFTTVEQPRQPSGSLQWSRVPSQTPKTTEPAAAFEPATAETTAGVNAPELNWQPLTATEIEQQQQQIEDEIREAQELIANPTIVPPPSGPTYANFRALWRDGDWLPQISNTVPVGFGPQGLMATFEFRGVDCITGAGLCTVPTDWNDYQNQISRTGDAFYDISIGFGDSTKTIGVILTAVIEGTEVPWGDRQSSSNGLFADKNLGIHISRNIGPDTAIRIGVENLFREVCDNGDCGLPQNAYGVVTQRLRLNQNQTTWFPNAYLTLGAGNGAYRPLSEQVQASIAAQRASGCSTYGYAPKKDCSPSTRRRAVYDAASYGNLTPIGAVGIEVFRGFNLIGEWSGRNLNAGLSFRPFEELGLVITPMWENLLPNCDYGCRVSVPDYPQGAPIPSNLLTERPRFSIQASVEIKF